MVARLGAQRAPGDSKHGLDHLLEPGLGREEHIKQAHMQQNPFGQDMPMDQDLDFAVDAMVRWGSHLEVEVSTATSSSESAGGTAATQGSLGTTPQ